MQAFDPNIPSLYEEAQRYERAGDSYNAIKLYKHLVKLEPEWIKPYQHLGAIYKQRREWKPAFHYWKKVVALDASDQQAWWNVGIAATALKKRRLAQSVWAKFGLTNLKREAKGLRLTYDGGFEILWMMPKTPATGIILSIPHPASGYRFRDEMLHARKPVGHHIVNRRRVPVFEELGRLKRSPFRTFSCLLHTADNEAISQLEQLCHEANLGFEVWSNATRATTMANREAFPEYYSHDILPREAEGSTTLVAMAAVHEIEVQRTLDSWQIISLEHYSDLRGY